MMPRSNSELNCAWPIVRPRLAAVAMAAATLALAVTTYAGVIDPAFQSYLANLPQDKQVSVIIMLAEQTPLAALDNQLRAESATLANRHLQVITSLREVAANTQGPLLAELAARKTAGEVNGFTPYWISNLVVAEMSVKAVRELAARSDVGIIYPNFGVSLIRQVGEPYEDPTAAAATPPGLCAINAKRVWYELGITGAGRLVGGLDTGVQGSHPALASRWRGTHVPWQEAWLDLLAGNTQFPNDGFGHGTHTMGTMCGLGVATQDTVGVAWGAEWIACNAINQGTSPAFDNDVIAAFQWFADPDGNPNTTADVPDVVQNSWRICEGCFPSNPPYTDCDPRWWAVMDGCEAAGCAVVFSAGNEGPGAQTIGSPPDRITTPTNAYAIGAVNATTCLNDPSTYAVVGFSSRGPSGCDHVTMKPEVVAPGFQVRSCWNNGGYLNSDGTSMAGPHVSGIFPLMRQANPNLDVTTMKQIIMSTAHDLGLPNFPGEDNNSGWGMVDAYAAVIVALQTTGVASHVPAADNLVRLLPVAPNPFNSPTQVSYVMPSRGQVALRLYDVQGRLVRTLADGFQDSGLHVASFDGRDQNGQKLATGTYFLRIDAGGQRDSKKLNIVR